MQNKSIRPVIVAAFANDRIDGQQYLRNLPDEMRRLRQIFESASELCEVVFLPNATLTELIDTLQTYRNRVAILHYAGHANSFQLLLESDLGSAHRVQAKGLAEILGKQRGLKLVFLNGCSTEKQTTELIKAGVPSVIATTQAIDDRIATQLSVRFYKGLVSGASMACSFEESVSEARASVGGDETRLLKSLDDSDSDSEVESSGRFPWFLQFAPGAEHLGDWSLPLAANNPLFGLPVVGPRDLPESPFRHLNWYRSDDAEIFFGRGREIRELYSQVAEVNSPPVVLLYGQSGVGKSSLLDAGLLPRLEGVVDTKYVRRDARLGLSGTLLQAIGGEASKETALATWKKLEADTGKPYVMVLDQVEECLTQPRDSEPCELKNFVELLVKIFRSASERPRGRLILGFRKEWFAEIDQCMTDFRLPRAKVFLDRLNRDGVIEVVQGPASSPRLQKAFRLSLDASLPGLIADDLLADPNTAVAPTLQILLTRMWDEARGKRPDGPSFDVQLYESMRRDGILLEDFLNQQLTKALQVLPAAASSGFVLDLLQAHTTELGTSAQMARRKLEELYPHQAANGLLQSTLRYCQDNYLLSESNASNGSQSISSRLSHDTLAPLVRVKHEHSDLPGQRARRILDHRVMDWRNGMQGEVLDIADLANVERGRDGTRVWDADEVRLIQESTKARSSRQLQKVLIRVAGVLAIASILMSAVFSWQANADLRVAERKARELVQSVQQEAEKAKQATEEAKQNRALALREFTKSLITVVKKVQQVQDDRLAAAHHLMSTADPGRNLSQKLTESARSIASQMLQGFRLANNVTVDGAVQQVWRLDDNQLLIWSSMFAPQSLTSIVIADSSSGTTRSLIQLDHLIRRASLRDDQRTLLVEYWKEKSIVTEDDMSMPGAAQYCLYLELWDVGSGKRIWEATSDPAFGSNPRADQLTFDTRFATSRNGSWMIVLSPDNWKLRNTLDGSVVIQSETIDPQDANESPRTIAKADASDDGRMVLIEYEAENFDYYARPRQVFAMMSTGEWKSIKKLSEGESAAVMFLGKNEFLVFDGNGEGTIYNRRGDAVTRLLDGRKTKEAFGYEVSPDGRRVAQCWENSFYVWNRDGKPNSDGPLPAFSPSEFWLGNNPSGVCFSPDGNLVAGWSADSFGIGKLNSDPSDIGFNLIKNPDDSSIQSLEFSHDSQTILSWSGDRASLADRFVGRSMTGADMGVARLWHVDTASQLSPALRHALAMKGADLSQDGKRILTWGLDGNVRDWAAPDQLPVRPIELTEAVIDRRMQLAENDQRDVLVSPDGSLQIKRHEDGFDVMDTQTQQVKLRLGHIGIRGFRFSKDGSKVLEWGGSMGQLKTLSGGYACLWDIRTGKQLTPALQHDLAVYRALFSEDESMILTMTALPNRVGTTSVHLWNVDLALEVIPRISCPNSPAAIADFDGDGFRIIVSGMQDSYLWDLTQFEPLPEQDAKRAIEERTKMYIDSFDEIKFGLPPSLTDPSKNNP